VFVSKITLKNWRNFHVLETNVSERLFVIGPNASGKSNFLDVFRFIRDIVKEGGGLQYAINSRGGLSKIRCLAARQDPTVEIEVELSEESEHPLWRYSIAIKQEQRGHRQPYVSHEKVTDLAKDKVILSRPDRDDNKDAERLTQTHLEQISLNEHFREIKTFFGSALYLHLVPQLLRHPSAFMGPGLVDDPFGKSLLERIAKTPEKTRAARLRKIEEALRLAVPQLSQLTFSRDQIGAPHLCSVYEHWRSKGAKQLEDQYSDGTLRLIGFLWSLLEGDSLLLLEEPELSLNPSIVQRLAPFISRFQRLRKRQVVVSTHSFDLLQDPGIGGEEVLLLSPGKEGTRGELVSNNVAFTNLLNAGLSVGEVVLTSTAPNDISKLDFIAP
jgi:predicted ATPase